MASMPYGQESMPQNGSQFAGSQYPSTGGYGEPMQKEQAVPGLNYMKGFSAPQKKMTRDGQPAKRRGPKPDSKPAQTRRQELNRQAQRTHRERKEQYIKSLEFEISTLRENYVNDINNLRTSLTQHKESLRQHQEENALLKEILRARGIPYQNELDSRRAQATAMNTQTSTYGGSMSGSMSARSGSFQTVTPSTMGGPTPSPGVNASFGNGMSNVISPTTGSTSYHSLSPPDSGVQERSFSRETSNMSGISELPGVFEQDPQLCVDFILALEHTCREHEEYLVRRSVNSPDNDEEAQFSGHALMASCPPPNHIANTPAQNHGLVPTYPHQVPSVSPEHLNTLLNLSRRLMEEGNIEGGQVTPIMALQCLKSHEKYHSLTKEDVRLMIDSLNSKVRCYGFGAVMEDFELMDALSSIFATKVETYEEAFGGSNADDDMYA